MSRISYLVLPAAVFALLGSGTGAAVRAASHDSPVLTHGVVVGDVTADTAVLWARADRQGALKVHLSGGKHHGAARLAFHSADDYAGQSAPNDGDVVLDDRDDESVWVELVGLSALRARPPASSRRRDRDDVTQGGAIPARNPAMALRAAGRLERDALGVAARKRTL
jgi:phosphodiesterase/alkaline phosphatase D-like protein